MQSEIVSMPARLEAVTLGQITQQYHTDGSMTPIERGEICAILLLDCGVLGQFPIYLTRTEFKKVLNTLNDLDERFALAVSQGTLN